MQCYKSDVALVFVFAFRYVIVKNLVDFLTNFSI